MQDVPSSTLLPNSLYLINEPYLLRCGFKYVEWKKTDKNPPSNSQYFFAKPIRKTNGSNGFLMLMPYRTEGDCFSNVTIWIAQVPSSPPAEGYITAYNRDMLDAVLDEFCTYKFS